VVVEAVDKGVLVVSVVDSVVVTGVVVGVVSVVDWVVASGVVSVEGAGVTSVVMVTKVVSGMDDDMVSDEVVSNEVDDVDETVSDDVDEVDEVDDEMDDEADEVVCEIIDRVVSIVVRIVVGI
jgi:hypothetical protein